jgi:hypothetical protein
MFARIATFEIPPNAPREVGDRIAAEVRRRIQEETGPEGAERVLIVVEPDRQRALNITFFDSEEHMKAAESFFDKMTPVEPDRRGRRTDVGHFRVVLDEPVAARA